MYAHAAYLGVIVIWATTPLAIQWSGEDVGFLFALTFRMALGVFASWIIMLGLKQSIPLHRRALKTYFASGLNIYFSMMCVYWGSQFIPSGWISVVFGMSPIITGVLAIVILGENSLLPHKLLGMILGMIGLILIFGNGYHFGHEFVLGITAVLLGTVSHSLSAVTIKNLEAGLNGIAATSGGLTIAMPLFFITWLIFEGTLPDTISARALYASIYLGVFASTVGFALYYYILTHMDVTRVSLITLITPVCALALGNFLNHEPVSPGVMAGTALIASGLLFHEYGRKTVNYLFRTS